LGELEDALHNPVWDIYLGRKSCVPTEFVAQGIHQGASEALAKADELADTKRRLPVYRVLQGEHEGEVLTLNDVPVQFGEQKLYRDRRVTVVPMVL
jgi:CRISPR system Cascade subunit CasD